MTRSTLCAVAVAAVALSAPVPPSGARPFHSGVDAPAEEVAVADTLRRLFRAAEQRDIGQVEALHSYGPQFSKFDEFGLGREDAAETRAAERRDLTSVKSFRAKVLDLKVDVFGGVAVATFVLDYTAETDRGVAAARLRSTVVVRKDRDAWRIVHEHYSPLLARQ